MADTVTVEVVYANAQQQWIKQIALARGSTVGQAIAASGIERELAGVNVDLQKLGIFSRRVDADRLLVDGDRIEIYRPLALDPMEARRRRARKD